MASTAPSGESDERECVLNADGGAEVDHKGRPVTVDRFLSTKPLRSEVSTRKGPGGMKLSYMGGDVVTKTLNEAFGYDGWSLEVKQTTREEPMKDDKGRYHVAYIATVRITHRRSGVFREDCGAGDSIDRSLASASGNALKGAVTDAMKRAARHFGEKLGNCLYHDGFNANNAPPTLQGALDTLDIDRAKSRFGFDKDRKVAAGHTSVAQPKPAQQTNQPAVARNTASVGAVKPEAKQAPPSRAPYAQKTPRTQYVGNVVMEHSNLSKPPHVTPHQGGANVPSANQNAAKQTNTSHVTPGNRTATANKKTFDASIFAPVPAEKMANGVPKENSNPQVPPPKAGLALPPRPGTSRGAAAGGQSPASAYIASLADGSGATPSMFGAGGSMSQALAAQQLSQPPGSQSVAQSLKRKCEATDGPGVGTIAKAANTGARNPYNC